MTAIRNVQTEGGMPCVVGPCRWLKRQTGTWVSWCELPENRVPPSPGWPHGFTPSLDPYNQGCASHSTGSVSRDLADLAAKGHLSR